MNVGPSSVKAARLVQAAAPDLAVKVEQGDMTVQAAAKEVKARRKPDLKLIVTGRTEAWRSVWFAIGWTAELHQVSQIHLSSGESIEEMTRLSRAPRRAATSTALWSSRSWITESNICRISGSLCIVHTSVREMPARRS